MLNFNICKITKKLIDISSSSSSVDNQNDKSIFMDKYLENNIKNHESSSSSSSSSIVIDEDNICESNLWQLILTSISCLLLLFTGLYQYYNLKKLFSRYNQTSDEFIDNHHSLYKQHHHLEHNNDDDYDDIIYDDNVDGDNDNIHNGNNDNNSHIKDLDDNDKKKKNNFRKTLTNNCTYNNNNVNNNNNNNNNNNSNNRTRYSIPNETTTTTLSNRNQILFKFHNIRCACELLLLAINTLEICKSLLPLPFDTITFWSSNKIINSITPSVTTTQTKQFSSMLFNQGYITTTTTTTPTLSASSLISNYNNNNDDKIQLILYSPPFVIWNSILAIFLTLILIGYHRILEIRNIPEFVYLSLPLEIILGIIRIYQIHSNVPNYFDLEPFLNWSTGFCLFILAIIDGYVLYKQRFKLKRVSKKLNEDRIGYKHSTSIFYSKILFWWLTPFLWHGYREPLEQDDLGHLREEDSARAYYDRFLLIYKTTAKKNKNPSLWLCYLKSSWKWFTLGGILKFFGDLSALIGPLSIHQIVDYIEYEYHRSYLNGSSILYNIQNYFTETQSFNYNNNMNNTNDNKNNFGNVKHMNLFTRINLNVIWSLLRAHSNSNHRKLNSIIESYTNTNNDTSNFTTTATTTNIPILNSTKIITDADTDDTDTIKNKWYELLNQFNDTNNYSADPKIGYNENIIRPLYSIVNSITEFLQLPTVTEFNLWANISWKINDEKENFSNFGKIILNNINDDDFTNYNSSFFNNQHQHYHNNHYTINHYYYYYYYPNWIEFLSNGWIIAWIVLMSAIAQGGLSQASTHLLNMTGIRIKTSLQGLIYRKTLLLSSSCIETNNIMNFRGNNNCNDSNYCDSEIIDDENNDNNKTKMYFNKILNNRNDNSKKKNKLSKDSNISNNSEKNSINSTNGIGGSKRDAGSITNLMTEDSLNVMSFFWIAHYVWAIPLKIGLVMYLLYLKLGVSAIIGSFVCILTMTPLQFLIGKAMSKNSEISAQCTDERLRKINDIFLGIKLIKLNAWEKVYRDKIAEVRKKELKYLNKESFYWTVMTFLTHLSSILITFVTLAVYVKLETTNQNESLNATVINSAKLPQSSSSTFNSFGFEFTASRLFSALALFNQLTVPLLIFPITVPIIISAIVSTKRLERFFREPEVQREFEGIKNMARILCKSDPSLDMYEIKKITESDDEALKSINKEIKERKSQIINPPISPITESECSIEFPLTYDDVQVTNLNKNQSNLNTLNSKNPKFENNLKNELNYALIDDNKRNIILKKDNCDDIKEINDDNDDDDDDDEEKLFSKFNVKPRKSFCDEIDEFDREYNESDEFDMENKSLTQFKDPCDESQQYINANNNNNKNNNNNNNNTNYNNIIYYNDSNQKKNNDCYDGKNDGITIISMTKSENEKQQKEIEKLSKENFETIEKIIETDSPRVSVNTKLKREYKNSYVLPKKRRNKDLKRVGGGGGGGGVDGNSVGVVKNPFISSFSISATSFIDRNTNNDNDNSNVSDSLNYNNKILRNKYDEKIKTKSKLNHNQDEIEMVQKKMNNDENDNDDGDDCDGGGSECNIISNPRKSTIHNSRKVISGRESFQFQIANNIAVSISNGEFSWDNCNISLRINELNIPKGKLTIVVGKNGSGKTSLIAALLKEMHQISGDISWNKYSTIAYVPQIPWLLNASIRDNIIFGESFRPKRYEKVLEACALKPDIDLMPEGDMTLIGERGINLSGGQKQRINIARSLYSSANVIMMDDPLSSLDNEVAKHVFENSIKKMLLKANRTVILVTQKLQLLSSAKYIIVMKDCFVQSTGNYEEIQKEHPDIVMEWNSMMAKGYDRDQMSPGKTARERWRLFKNVSRIGLLRPQDAEQEHLLSIYLVGIKVKLKIIEILQRNSDENQLIDNQSLYMQTKRRSSIFGSRHLIYDIPLPIDECQNDDIIIKRRGSKRSILLMGLGNAISGSNIINYDLRQNDSGGNIGVRRKNSVLRVKSLQSDMKSCVSRAPVTRNISSPGRFLDTKARTSDSEFKPKTGFRQFLSRMSSRRSNLGTKLHRPLSATNSIQSISEESHPHLQRVESSCSSEFIDDESVQDSNNELNENGTLPNDDERKYGEIPLQIYMLYLKSCGLPIVLTFFITALIWQCLRVYTDVWLRYWTEMDTTKIIRQQSQRIIKDTIISTIMSTTTTTTTETAFNLNRDNINSSFNIFNNSFNDINIGYGGNRITSIFTENDKQQEQQQQQQQNDVTYCFSMYTIISSLCILMSIISIPAGQKAGCSAREKLHDQLLDSLLSKPLHFFQITPLGKIINRFSNDMAIIDKKIAPTSQRLLQFTLLCLCAVLINLAITPWFIILTIPICFAYYIIQKFYRCSSRELQRLENITNSPVISHFNETIQGVTTIRAYSQESRFTETLFRRLEANTIAFVMLNTSNRWLGIALDYLGGVIVFIAIITALLAASISKGHEKLYYNRDDENFHSHDRYYNNQHSLYLNSTNLNSTPSSGSSSSSSGMRDYQGNDKNIYYENVESLLSNLSPSPSLVGLAINYTLLVPIYLNWVVKLLSDMEMYVGSVERVAYYKQKLNENFNFWKNCKYNDNELRNNHHHHHHHHEHQYNEKRHENDYHCCNCQEKEQQQQQQQQQAYDENNLCSEKMNSNTVSSCTKCNIKSIRKKETTTNKNSEILNDEKSHDSKNVFCSMKCYCNEHDSSSVTADELNQIIFNTVPISWPQKGDIEFENITLRYQGQNQNIITDLSLKIPAGQKIGICGRTGSGKSTLALSLFSVMEVINGKILIDDININTIHPDEVRSRLSIIPQDVHLFNATIRENLDPRNHYSDLELWNCLELSQLKDIVTRMPHGLDTEIIEGGFNLSAGQRQLFCLARAVLRGSVCLVLDEATSSLDSVTEKALMDAAHNAFKGRTIITIAHRLSTLLNYDRIIVLENGKIIEDGAPDDLKEIPNGKFVTMLQSGH